MSRSLKIGDVVPCVGPVDRELVRISHSRRGRIAEAISSTRQNHAVNQARLIATAIREREARAESLIEQAKTFIRRRGWNVFAAEIVDGPAGHFVIGKTTVTEGQLFAFAERHGWKREPST